VALHTAAGVEAPLALPWAPPPAEAAAVTILDLPPRLDDAVRRALVEADRVLVAVDAGALARRALREVAAALGDRAPAVLRVALARTLPRDVDRWALLEELEALAPGAMLATTLPAGRVRDATPRLYAPGTAGARAYARVAAELGLVSASTTP
jgi:cellulose biosynthesis protein BcsQ